MSSRSGSGALPWAGNTCSDGRAAELGFPPESAVSCEGSSKLLCLSGPLCLSLDGSPAQQAFTGDLFRLLRPGGCLPCSPLPPMSQGPGVPAPGGRGAGIRVFTVTALPHPPWWRGQDHAGVGWPPTQGTPPTGAALRAQGRARPGAAEVPPSLLSSSTGCGHYADTGDTRGGWGRVPAAAREAQQQEDTQPLQAAEDSQRRCYWRARKRLLAEQRLPGRMAQMGEGGD